MTYYRYPSTGSAAENWKRILRLYPIPKLAFFISFLSCSCSSFVTRGQSSDDESGCILPPETFKESDLIGTWYAGHSKRNDTLILREDGKYKQILNVQIPEYHYESEWRDWWVEDRGSGTPYLHLEGMHLCVYHIGRDCKVEGGGPGAWYDFCEKRSVLMPGEGILPVLGTPKGLVQPPRGIFLVPFDKDPDPGGGFSYKLKE